MCAQYAEIDFDPYTSLAVDQLVVGTSLLFEVFVKEHSIVSPLFNKGRVFDGIALNLLHERGISEIYIKTEDSINLEAYLSRSRESKKTLPDPETYRQYVASKNQYYLIDRGLLRTGTRISFNLYVLNNFRMSVLLPATEKATAAIDDRVVTTPGDVMIDPADTPRYHEYLNSLLSASDATERGRAQARHGAIKENSKLVLKDLISNPRSGEKIKESISLVSKMVDSILESRDALSNLLSLRTHDYYTYTHSVNVAVFAVGLGMASGLPKEDIEKLGIGAMLHDVGKSFVASSIINKAGRLSDDEFRIMKKHVIEGEKILRMHQDIPEESLVVVSQHHERLSGKGYPYQKSGKDIHPLGRIASIVDCYDAMTTERSYQPAHTPFFALSLMTRETSDYDLEVIKVFIKMLGQLKLQ